MTLNSTRLQRSAVIREVGLRDGLQSIATILPTAQKIEWIRAAHAAGQREIEVGSFVPARLLPQLADTAELVAFAKTLGGRGQMRHVVTSMLADGDRERTTVRSYCHVTSVGGDGKPFISVQGVYEDELTHTGEVWLFTKRRFSSDK